MTSSTALRHKTEIATRSVLLPNKDGLLLDVFGKEFKAFMGHSFPYEKLGYVSMLELLKAMPEVVDVTQLHSGHILLNAVPEESTQDLHRMVSKQKPNEEGYSRKTIQVVQQEKNRLLKLNWGIEVDRFNPSQYLNPNGFKPEMSAKLVTENNTKTLNLVQKLVSDEEKKKLRSVLAPFPAGVPLSQYSREYRNFFGHELRPSDFNCESIAQFCAELPDIFVIGREGSLGYSGDWILHLAAQPQLQQTQPTLLPTQQTEATSLPTQQAEATPLPTQQTEATPLPSQQTQAMPHPSQQTQAMPLPSRQTQATPLPTQQTQATPLPTRQTLATPLSTRQTLATPLSTQQTEATPLSTQQNEATPLPTQQTQATPLPIQQTQATPLPTRQTQAKSLPSQQTSATPPPTLPKYRSSLAKIHVPDKVVANVELILERFPEGIKKSKFLDVYQNLTGVYLNVKPFGFKKIDDFFHHLHSKGVFQMANSFLTLWNNFCDPRSPMTPKAEKAESKPHVEENTEDVTDHELTIFKNVMKPGDDVEQQSLAADMKVGDFLDIIVGEIFHPHKFWIQCKGNDISEALEKLMKAMDTFYNDVETTKNLQVPKAFLVSGLICATLFEGSWHRVRVTSVQDPTNVCLFCLDYGTVTTADKDSVLCLDKTFGLLPAQAIPARLAGVKPAAPASKFPRDTSLRFLELVKEYHGDFGLPSVVSGIGQFVDLWLFTNLDKKFSINQILVDENLASSDCDVCHQFKPCFASDENALPDCKWRFSNSVSGIKENKPCNLDEVDNGLSDFVGDDSTDLTFDNIDSSGYDSKKSTETLVSFGIVNRKNRKPSDIVRSILRKKELALKQNKQIVNQANPQLSSTKLPETVVKDRSSSVAVVDETKRGVDASMEMLKSTERTNDEGGTVLGACGIMCATSLKDGCLQAIRANIDGNVTAVMFDRNQTRRFNVTLETMNGEKSSFGYVRKKEGMEADLEANQGGFVGGTESWSYDPKIEKCRLRTVRVNYDGVVTIVLFDKMQTRCFTVCLETVDGKRSSFGYPNIMEDVETEEFDEEGKKEGGTVGGGSKYDPKLESNGTQTFTAGVDGYEMTVVIDKSKAKCFTINLETVDGTVASFGGPGIKAFGD